MPIFRTAAIHKDSSEVKSVNDWIKYQCGKAAMTDASGVVPSIKSDRAGGPRVEIWGDWLQRIYVPECTLPLSFGDVGCVYHLHRPHLWGKAFLSSIVQRPGLFLIISMQPLVIVFGN